MIHVQVRGIDVDYNEKAAEDFRMVQLLTKMKRKPDDVTAAWDFVCLFFGEEQFCRILDELEDTSFEGVQAFIGEAIAAAAEERGEDPKN